jgi:hypothetical protein
MGSVLGFSTTFSMMQDVLFVLTRHSSQNSKLALVVGIYMYLPIITSRELVDAHLATYEMRLGYLQKITEHNGPFVPAHHESVHIHYRSL